MMKKKEYLCGQASGEAFRIGDSIKIRVIEANKLQRRVSFERVK